MLLESMLKKKQWNIIVDKYDWIWLAVKRSDNPKEKRDPSITQQARQALGFDEVCVKCVGFTRSFGMMKCHLELK